MPLLYLERTGDVSLSNVRIILVNIVRGFLSVVFGAMLTTQASTAFATCDVEIELVAIDGLIDNTIECEDQGEFGEARILNNGDFCRIIFYGNTRQQNILIKDAAGDPVDSVLFQEDGNFFGSDEQCLNWVFVRLVAR